MNVCIGGERGRCPRPVVWLVRLSTDSEDGYWTPSCGLHLHWASSEATGGEQGRLDLKRVQTDER